MAHLIVRMLVLLCLLTVAHGAKLEEYRILYINSYSAGYGWSNRVLAGFRHGFQGRALPVSIQCYDLDVFFKRGLRPAAADVELLRQLVRTSEYDLLVTADNPATDLFLSGAIERPSQTPLLVTGYNCSEANEVLRPGVTGITVPQTIPANIKLGMRLFPETEAVAIILDGSADGQGIYHYLKQELDKINHPQVRIFCGAHYSTRELFAELGNLPEKTLLVYQGWRSTSPEPYRAPRELLADIVAKNPEKPLLFTRVHCFDAVKSGGFMVDGFALGQSAACLAKELLTGTPLNRLLPVTAAMQPQFDHAFLNRHKFGANDLPKGALVRNKPLPAMLRYRGEIIGFSAIFPLLLCLGGICLWRSRRARKRLEAVFGQIPARGGIIDAKERPRFFFSQNMGMSVERSRSVFEHLPEETQTRLRECFYQVFRDGEERQLQYLFQGRARNITFRRLPRQLFGIDSIIWVSQDIEDLVAARRNAEYTARNFDLTVSNISEGVITTDDNEVILYANPKSAELVGCAVNDLIGRNFGEMLSLIREGKDEQRCSPVREALLSQEAVEIFRDLTLMGKDGSRHAVAISTAPILEENGKCHGTVTVFRDIAGLRKLEKLLRHHNRQLHGNIEQVKVLNRCLEIITAEYHGDSAAEDVLRLVCQYLHADHCVLYRYVEESMQIVPVAQYRMPGIARPLPGVPLVVDTSWYRRFERREPILMSSMSEIKEVGLEEQRSAFVENDVKSIGGIGVLYGNQIWGHLCICYQQKEHRFTPGEQRFLLAVGHLFELLISGRGFRERLQRSEHEKQMMLNALSYPIMLWDANGKTVFVNTAALALKNLSLEQALAHPCHEVFCGKNPPPDDCPMRKAFCDGKEHSRVIHTFGSRYQVTARPLFENGVLSYVLASAIDLEGCSRIE